MHGVIEELLKVSPSHSPMLSVYVDTRPAGAGMDHGHRRRPGLVWLKERLSRLRTAASSLPDLLADTDHIERYVDSELAPGTQGLAIFASGARSLFRPIQLELPLPNELVLNSEPYLFPLVRLLDHARSYAVILADHTRAHVYAVAMGQIHEAAHLEHPPERPERPSRTLFAASQPRYQRYLGEQVRRHLEEVVRRTHDVIAEERLDFLFLAGDKRTLGELRAMLPSDMSARLLESIPMDLTIEAGAVLKTTLARLEEHLHQRLDDKLHWVQGQHMTGGLGVLGLAATFQALNAGQVDELLLSERVHSPAWMCQGCQRLFERSPGPGRCPLCSGVLVLLTDVKETVAQAAERTGARLQVVPEASLLDVWGGMGAVLRYRSLPVEVA